MKKMACLCLMVAFLLAACGTAGATSMTNAPETGGAPMAAAIPGNGENGPQPYTGSLAHHDHIHELATEPQTVEDPVSGYCGNTVTTVYVDGKTYSFCFDDSVALTDLLINLDYDPEQVCRCVTEFTVDTEFGTGYGVNLTEGFARCEKGQVSLTAQQVETIREILERQAKA